MFTTNLKYDVIFGGGAVRGIAYIGAVKALNELGVEIGALAGSSVGAIFAGLLAVGYSVEELKELFLDINFDLFKDIHFGLGKEFALSKGEVFLDWLRELIEKKYYGDVYNKNVSLPVTFKDLNKDLVIITTDLTNFKCKEFSKYETPDFEIAKAIRISSTMPGLMPPYKFENSELVDGDLQKSWPLWKLSKTLNSKEDRILEFRLEGDYAGKGKNAINFINTVYSCVTAIATDFIVDCYGNKDKYDYIILNTGEVVIVDFNQPKEKREHLIQIGYDLTMQYFKDTLPVKKRFIFEQYGIILNHLNVMKQCLNSRKISRMKEEMGLMYVDLHEVNKVIDENIFEQINNFKTIFYDNLSEPNLFGIYPKSGVTAVETALMLLEVRIDMRRKELALYCSRSEEFV
ncbi:patatin-like phospholipase family protein [bacterium]|nr:patatin-like phospholipase family protein [bacterium]